MSETQVIAPERDEGGVVLPIDRILVADRFRKDLGDVSELAKSIVEVGLLNPVTVTEYFGGFRLLAGERRLRAFQSLGLAEIPARVARDISDARDALVAERDENTQRKPMLPSEATALGIAIQEWEAVAAKERQRFHGGTAPGITSVPGNGSDGHDSRDLAAEAVGMSPATFTRMKTLMTAAANEDEPEEVREAAREAVEAIDGGAPVRGGYDRVKEVRRRSESVTTETAPVKRANDPTDYHVALAAKYPTVRIAFEREGHERYASLGSLEQSARACGVPWRFTEKQYQAHVAKSAERLDRASLSIEAALGALELVDFTTITTEQAVEALQRIDRSQLNLYIRSLKEITNAEH